MNRTSRRSALLGLVMATAASAAVAIAAPASATGPVATTVVLTATPAVSSSDTAPLQLTATVGAGTGSFTGSVTFYAGNVGLGATTLGSAALVGKTASLDPTPSSIPVGDILITARYSGDSSNQVSVSVPVLRQRYYVDAAPGSANFSNALYAADHGFFPTPANGKYGAGVHITRGTAATVLLKYAKPGVLPTPCTAPAYGDVPVDSPDCPGAAFLYGLNVGHGFAFDASSPLTRQDLMLWLYAVEHDGVVAPSCKVPVSGDVLDSDPHCGAVAWAIEQKLATVTVTQGESSIGAGVHIERNGLVGVLRKLDTALSHNVYARVRSTSNARDYLEPIQSATGKLGAVIELPKNDTAVAVNSGASVAYVGGGSGSTSYLTALQLPGGAVLASRKGLSSGEIDQIVTSSDNTKVYTATNDQATSKGVVTSYSATLTVPTTVSNSGTVYSLVSAGSRVAWASIQAANHQLHSVTTATGKKGPAIAITTGAIRLTADGSYGWVMGGPYLGQTLTLVDLAHGTFATPVNFAHGFTDLQIVGGGAGQLAVGGAAGTDAVVLLDLVQTAAPDVAEVNGVMGQIALTSSQRAADVVTTRGAANPGVVEVNLVDHSAGALINFGSYYLSSLLQQPGGM